MHFYQGLRGAAVLYKHHNLRMTGLSLGHEEDLVSESTVQRTRPETLVTSR